MSFAIPLITSGLGALGGLFGNKGQKQQQQSTNNSQSSYGNTAINSYAGGQSNNTSGTSWTNPTLMPQANSMLDAISGKYLTMMGSDPDLKGYQASQISDIDKLAGIRDKAMAENYASRGITGPAAAAGMASSSNQTFSDKTKLNQQIPLLANQLNLQQLGQAGQFFSQIPQGMQAGNAQSSYGEQSGGSTQYNSGNQWNSGQGTGQQQQSGNAAGGAFGSLGSILAYLFGQGGMGGKSSGDMSMGAGY